MLSGTTLLMENQLTEYVNSPLLIETCLYHLIYGSDWVEKISRPVLSEQTLAEFIM